MAVESTTTISGLNAAWPLGTDVKAEGDNHLRLIKGTLQAVFDDSGATMKTTKPLEVPDVKRSGGAQPVGTVVMTVLTSSGTYTKPAGLVSLEVWVVGGGGGGGVSAASAASQASASGGGGAGGVAHKVYQAAGLLATESYTVGTGGAGGTGGAQVGGNGGSSTFKGMTGLGGSGGNWQASTASLGATVAGGAGGGATGGDLNLTGGDGEMGIGNPHSRAGTAIQGSGGVNMFGQRYATALVTGVSAAFAGRFPGGGGTGSSVSNVAGSNTNGGAGAGGCILLKERY